MRRSEVILPDCQSMGWLFPLWYLVLKTVRLCEVGVGHSVSHLLSSPVGWGRGLTPGHPPWCCVQCSESPWDARITSPSHASWGIRPSKLVGLNLSPDPLTPLGGNWSWPFLFFFSGMFQVVFWECDMVFKCLFYNSTFIQYLASDTYWYFFFCSTFCYPDTDLNKSVKYCKGILCTTSFKIWLGCHSLFQRSFPDPGIKSAVRAHCKSSPRGSNGDHAFPKLREVHIQWTTFWKACNCTQAK